MQFILASYQALIGLIQILVPFWFRSVRPELHVTHDELSFTVAQ